MEDYRNTKPAELHPELNSPAMQAQNLDTLTTPDNKHANPDNINLKPDSLGTQRNAPVLTTPNLPSLSTPYFLIDEAELRSNVDKLQAALNDPDTGWDNSLIAYSFKTNALPWLLDYFKNCGFYAEAASDDEYNLALAMGYDKDKIVYNSPCKTRETFIDALNHGCIVNIDSQMELQWLRELDASDKLKSDGSQDTRTNATNTGDFDENLRTSDTRNLEATTNVFQNEADTNRRPRYAVGIRVNFDLESHCPGECSMGTEGSRFGFCYENGELKRAIDFIHELDHVSLVGLHLHFSSKTRSLRIYRTLAQMACKIAEAYQLSLNYVDIGGGFFGGLPDKPQFSDYIEAISSELIKTFDKSKTALIVEPGTSLVSSPFSFVTTVTDVKQTTANTFVVTDGSRIYVDPLMKKTGYFFEVDYRGDAYRDAGGRSNSPSRLEYKENESPEIDPQTDEANSLKALPDSNIALSDSNVASSGSNVALSDSNVAEQVICGFTCMEFDRLFVLKDHPPLSVGDRIIYHKVGAYTMCLSPLFIKNFPAVYVKDGERCFCVRQPGTVEDFIKINT